MEHKPFPPDATKPPQSKFPWPLVALAVAVVLLIVRSASAEPAFGRRVAATHERGQPGRDLVAQSNDMVEVDVPQDGDPRHSSPRASSRGPTRSPRTRRQTTTSRYFSLPAGPPPWPRL